MVELIQFRKRQVIGRDGPFVVEYRQAQVVADQYGHLVVATDENGQVQYGEWQKIRGA